MKRMRRWMLALVAAVLILGVAAAVVGGLWAHRISTAAATGRTQVQAGAKALAGQDATTALSQFKAASTTFGSAKRDLGPDWVAGVVRRIPWAGRQYSAAQTLLSIGLDGSSAGTQVAEALRRVSGTSATATPANRFALLLAGGHNNVQSALTSLSDAADRADGLSADGLIPQLAKAVVSVKAALSGATSLLGRSRPFLQLVSYLSSGNHRLLVISQDGAELRPTGGFPGTFGIIDVGSAGLRLEKYQDVYVLPDPRGIVPPPPGAAMTRDFSFRDAGWWIDFPTSAKAMLGFWQTYRQPPVEGLIAIDTVSMKALLGAIGPVHVKSYNETFTAANLLERLLYLVEIKKQDKSVKKGVVTALATELEARVLGASPARLGRAAVAMGQAADAKHIQMYFTDPSAQAAADALRWSGRVAPPSGTTDVVAISNAMNQAGKVNIAMKKTIDYSVGLQQDGSAETTLVLSYANSGPYPVGMPSRFIDWLRVYRAAGTEFPSATPDGSRTVTLTEFGFPAEVRTFTLNRHQRCIQTLVARVPHALADGAPTGKSGVSVYRLHFVRQDELTDLPLSITVTAPSGLQVTGTSARLSASGAALPVSASRDRAHMAIPLSGDLDLEVRLARN